MTANAPTRPRSSDAVVRHVERELGSGALTIGSRLPAERMLAEQLGVSRSSVREGIRVLEAMGVIRTAVGSGPDAGATVISEAATGFTGTLRLHLASTGLPVADVVRTRLMVESWSVAEAARNPDEEVLARAEMLLHTMDAPGLSAADFLRLDADYHVCLAAAADNAVVTAIMTSLREAIAGYVTAAVPSLPDWPAMQRTLRRQHRAILAAVRDGDPERASRLVSRHIDGFYRAADLA